MVKTESGYGVQRLSDRLVAPFANIRQAYIGQVTLGTYGPSWESRYIWKPITVVRTLSVKEVPGPAVPQENQFFFYDARLWLVSRKTDNGFFLLKKFGDHGWVDAGFVKTLPTEALLLRFVEDEQAIEKQKQELAQELAREAFIERLSRVFGAMVTVGLAAIFLAVALCFLAASINGIRLAIWGG